MIELEELLSNATAQRSLLKKQNIAKDQLDELNSLLNITYNPERRNMLLFKPKVKKKNEELWKKKKKLLVLLKKDKRKLLKQIDSLQSKRHHYSMSIQVNSVLRNEMPKHIDEYYCLHIVKGAKQFAYSFASHSVIILQDDKAKVPLDISAVGRTFKTLQTVQEPVTIPDHNFSKGKKQKLIPSVYLTIDINNSDNSLHNALKCKDEVKPILVLLVDDYFIIQTHISGQSIYNPVECNMSTLSGKLAGIVLPINHFGSHLNSSDDVIDSKLANQNFNYAGERLCDIWQQDYIYEKEVLVEYVNQEANIFSEVSTEEAYVLLDENDGFLPSATK
ncbi:24730_t:CDS:2, partial [Cetraspora pellucida]